MAPTGTLIHLHEEQLQQDIAGRSVSGSELLLPCVLYITNGFYADVDAGWAGEAMCDTTGFQIGVR
ncbi:hypothetical protein [Paenibacillus xerothermodurans]|uniref:Uncharacterized protein n=1 Tax=Paenibacillus xerothermodurans TaxID=1977292 RepID=A0A2W1NV45_PAEXE|nr:hypothetical protein [Paenibacillus xerothermodurans]PZE21636.1 hypothetical protein CBW46_004215 [Paenibacillus xerothermodurans]